MLRSRRRRVPGQLLSTPIRSTSTGLLMAALALIGPASSLRAAVHPDAANLAHYLPEELSYDRQIPTPAQVLGFELGSWHVRPWQQVRYLEELAKASPRLVLQQRGETWARRPLPLLVVTSPDNQARLEELREARLQATVGGSQEATGNTEGHPVVVYLAYSVHGNEASGANAAMAVAYYLAAAQGDEIESLLQNSVILLDPSLNPDGIGRFAEWANGHRAKVPVSTPAHREHGEGWPNGRTNHYWFDLNRDWLPAQHPESQARLRTFHLWYPNVLGDFHEMGPNATFFFQPGVPSRQNPLTPQRNLELTHELAGYTARALDRAERLYYTQETFDDFYYGKGSTYPDVQGAVGILYEQASVRGLVQDTERGLLTFPFAIQNQVTASLALLHGAHEQRQQLLQYQFQFFREARQANTGTKVAAYVVGDDGDPARAWHFLEVLRRHRIEVRELAQELPAEQGRAGDAGGEDFRPGHAWVVPVRQAQQRMVRASFEQPTQFADSTFYDVSAWTLPLAFGLPVRALERLSPQIMGMSPGDLPFPSGQVLPNADPAETAAGEQESRNSIWALPWHGYYAPRALYRLLDNGIEARVSTRPLELPGGQQPRDLGYGAVVVSSAEQQARAEDIGRLLADIALHDGVDVHTLDSALNNQGIDLGSPSLAKLERPRPALVVGPGVNPYRAGEVWHVLDRRAQIPLTLLDRHRISTETLQRHSHLILVSGRYETLPESTVRALRQWLRDGGVLLAQQEAIPWVDENLVPEHTADAPTNATATASNAAAHDEPAEEVEEITPQPYGDREANRARQLISGAIFEVDVDVTHPLAYGYRQPNLAVFRNNAQALQRPDNAYAMPLRYTQDPLLAGYASAQNLQRLAGTPAITTQTVGRGVLIRMADASSFRAFWYGTDRLLYNSLFFGHLLRGAP